MQLAATINDAVAQEEQLREKVGADKDLLCMLRLIYGV